jgi:hypothetical protein
MTGRRGLALLATLVSLAALLVAAYYYGKGKCPPPDWWFRVFHRSGTYRCAG